MSDKPPYSHDQTYSGRISAALLGVTLFLVLALVYFHLASPDQIFQRFDPFEDYPTTPMQDAVEVEKVKNEHRAILDLGSRFTGQPGYHQTANYIRTAYEQAGLEIYTQEFQSVAPKTAYREINQVHRNIDGSTWHLEPIDNVSVYPFFPNFLQAVATPPGGMMGEVVLINDETLNTRQNFDGCIGLIDSREENVPQGYGFDWTRYANLGIEALIISHSEGLNNAPWVKFSPSDDTWAMVSSVPINYVRLAATKEIFNYIGEEIHLRVRVDYKRIDDLNLFGVLRSAQPSKEAILFLAPYDAPSIIPDLAPGILPAISPAFQLRLLQGLLPYAETLQRDIIFASMGSSSMGEEGHNNLMRVIGRRNRNFKPDRLLNLGEAVSNRDQLESAELDDGDPRQVLLADNWEENERQGLLVEEILKLLEIENFAKDPESTRQILRELDRTVRKFAEEQFGYVVKTLAFELSEPLMATKLEVEREGGTANVDSEAFHNYLEARKEYNDAYVASGYQMTSMLRNKPETMEQYSIRNRFLHRMEDLKRLHDRRRRELKQEESLLNLFSQYERIGLFSNKLAPAPPQSNEGTEYVSSGSGVANIQSTIHMIPLRLMNRAKRRLEIGVNLEIPPAGERQDQLISRHTGYFVSRNVPKNWGNLGFPTFYIYNLERIKSFSHYASPVDLPFMRDLETLSNTFKIVGETLLSLAHANGSLDPHHISIDQRSREFGGRVLAAEIGQSLIPNYPVKDALVACRSPTNKNLWAFPGHYRHPILMTDDYGRYRVSRTYNVFPVYSSVGRDSGLIAPLAVRIGEDGIISHIKDEGNVTQRSFKSTKVPWWKAQDLTLIIFPAAPITVLDLINPQTLREYAGVKMIRSEGLATPDRFCFFENRGLVATFLEPDQRCFVELQSGAQEHERAKVTRAFLTNVDEMPVSDRQEEIDGEGYLVGDHPFVRNLPAEVAHSMAYVNGRRLDLQNSYGMADERPKRYHEKVTTHIDQSQTINLSKKESIREARQAVTYATLNHPVLRESIMEAVIGILWYLALLVPFIFFFEKLMFCFPDVRKQIIAQAIIFLVVFALLRILHPAFAMVRSSLMILLGFIIILISTGITILFTGKYKESFNELMKKRGKVDAAEVNKLGVIASAFMLGLNNMNRRKARTGLTCATLSMITFVIICFASIQDDLVEDNFATGKALYNGFLLKQEEMAPFRPSEVQAIEEKYGDRYDVCPRFMLIGHEDYRLRRRNADLEISYKKGLQSRQVEFDSVIRLKHNDPMRNQIRILTDTEWFTEEDEIGSANLIPVFIPDAMAERLSISVHQVNTQEVRVWINGEECEVRGIFDSEAYNNTTDLDGYRVLPFDVTAIEVLTKTGDGVVASEDEPKIPADKIILLPYSDHRFVINEGAERVISVAISMPKAGRKEVKTVVNGFLDQTTKPLSYGLEGVAYWARHTREAKIGDFLDLVIPLFIAAFTVLNTMRGSVYERRDEIYVYNSVGIAPRNIFFMFLTEAFVYAVVGSVLGDILSQGTGRILTVLDMTGGLNMTFTSLTTIYASVVLFGAVLISTYFPAKSAMEIAAPAEDAGWSLPEPQGNFLHFHLPFTFNRQGRVGILAFFDRKLLDHGEGGSGRFFSNQPKFFVAPEEHTLVDKTYVPAISATVWLKPFDQAVSQNLTISMPPDEEAREYKVRIEIERLSGTRDSWLRLNRDFVSQIRQHFLHWRALSPEDREELFSEAKEKLEESFSHDLTSAVT